MLSITGEDAEHHKDAEHHLQVPGTPQHHPQPLQGQTLNPLSREPPPPGSWHPGARLSPRWSLQDRDRDQDRERGRRTAAGGGGQRGPGGGSAAPTAANRGLRGVPRAEPGRCGAAPSPPPRPPAAPSGSGHPRRGRAGSPAPSPGSGRCRGGGGGGCWRCCWLLSSFLAR